MERKLEENLEKQIQKLAQMGLLPGTETIDESRERIRQEAAKSLERIRDQFAQVGTPDWQAGLDLNPERYSRLKFDLEGRYLLVATSQAARVYRWEEMARATDHLPEPFATVAGDISPIEAGRGVKLPGGTIYDLDYDPERDRVIFAGLDGRVRSSRPSHPALGCADGRAGAASDHRARVVRRPFRPVLHLRSRHV